MSRYPKIYFDVKARFRNFYHRYIPFSGANLSLKKLSVVELGEASLAM